MVSHQAKIYFTTRFERMIFQLEQYLGGDYKVGSEQLCHGADLGASLRSVNFIDRP